MGLRTVVCIDNVNTTMVVVLFCIFVYDIWIQLYSLAPPMSEKAGKESQFGLAPLFRLGGGRGRDIYSMYIKINGYIFSFSKTN